MIACLHSILRSSARLASSKQTSSRFSGNKGVVSCLRSRHQLNAVFSVFDSRPSDNSDSSRTPTKQSLQSRRYLNNGACTSEQEMLYTKTHEYLRFVSSNSAEAAVGVSDFASQELGDVVYIESLVSEQADDGRVTKGDAVCTLEALKSVAEVYAPVSGRILSFNEKVKRDPGLINRDPEGDGWIFRMTVDVSESSSEGQTEQPQSAARHALLSAGEYAAHIRREIGDSG